MVIPDCNLCRGLLHRIEMEASPVSARTEEATRTSPVKMSGLSGEVLDFLGDLACGYERQASCGQASTSPAATPSTHVGSPLSFQSPDETIPNAEQKQYRSGPTSTLLLSPLTLALLEAERCAKQIVTCALFAAVANHNIANGCVRLQIG